MGEVRHRCCARVGLLGNPSDGYFGKTISFSLANFFAEVSLKPSDEIWVEPHPVHDLTHFPSLEQLASQCDPLSTYGGVRLLLSLCRCFHRYCTDQGIDLPQGKNFTLSYDTNIPRQAGLSGSSAIVAAGLKCLVHFYALGERIPLVQRPSLVLEAETALGIVAGLQDRVVQVFGGLVYMDFNKELLERSGHGVYEKMPVELLPHLHVIYANNPSDSGKVHSTVKQRWLAGEHQVVKAMEEVASLAEQGREALQQKDYSRLASLINRNFDLRRSMFGDAALGSVNLDMIDTARSVGAAAKFTGSGGAIIVLCLDGSEQESRLRKLCSEKGYHMVEARIAPE